MIDLVLYNCRIFGKEDTLDTISIKSGRIVDIGNNLPESCRKKIDLEGRTVIPGYIDSHTHLLDLGLSINRLDLSNAKSRGDALEMISTYARDSGSKVIVGYGWDETDWGETDYITGKEIDNIDRPVVLFRRDMHMATANSNALRIAGLESGDGVVREEELMKLESLTQPDDGEIRDALSAAADKAVSEGITSVRDISSLKVMEMLEQELLPIRIFNTIYAREVENSQMHYDRMWGIKIFLDGSIGSVSAAHKGWPDSNIKFSDENLQAHLESLWKSGYQIAMHAIGENAVRQAVRALQQQRGNLRNSIEHFELVSEDVLQEIGSPSVISSQPNFLQWSMKGGLYENKLGKEWFGKDNPFRNIIDSGATLAFGSDCMPMGPSYGIGLSVNSPHPAQRITVEEAIRAYTTGGAYLLHEEHTTGKVEIGYRADLAVFDENYLTDLNSIGRKKALMTILDGDVVYDSMKSREPVDGNFPA